MSNRLGEQGSPYLRQHADNPVDWFPWSDEALNLARVERKPILLSIGYAACHWCHVMAHECFEDAEVAAQMNRLFINIKVDREERPDLDHLYQRAHQMLTGRPGGWPLTVFLTPDQTPFFSGTYFPKASRHGLIGFPELMERIDLAWRTQQQALARQNAALRAQLLRLGEPADARTDQDSEQLTREAIAALFAQRDPVHGGLGSAPKFPHPVEWQLLFDLGDPPAREAALHTLRTMALGGLQDHVGGGFFRYCVDGDWQIPHFEKMLYDNALLLPLYAQAARQTGDSLFADAARGIVAWLRREMLIEDGDEVGFCASLDADSDHQEGAFYVWQRDEARAAIGAADWPLAEAAFNLSLAPNFEDSAWHLRRSDGDSTLAARLGLNLDHVRGPLQRIRGALAAARDRRNRPGRDDKRISSWNALTVTGLLRAGDLLNEPEWIALAQRAIDTLRATHWRDGRLRAVRQHGESRLNGYLDDHAFLLDALVTALTVDWRDEDLAFARDLAEVLIDHFQDAKGLLWMVSDDHETLVARPREIHDNATPAGASLAIGALARLGAIDGDSRWREAAERTFTALLPEAAAYPAAAASFWRAALWVAKPPTVVTVHGPRDGFAQWRSSISAWLPENGLIVCRVDLETPGRAMLCSGSICYPPVVSPAALARQWRER